MKKIKKILNQKEKKMIKIDYIIVSIIIIAYTILSFINLGTFKNPQTFYTLKKDETVTFVFENREDLIRTKFYSGDIAGEYAIYASLDNEDYDYITTVSSNGAFAWNEERTTKNTKYLRILSITDNSSLGEISFYNNSEEQIKIEKVLTSSATKQITTLTDESETIPEQISYMNSSYFDEIYFARTAYDYKEGIEAYEWVHPPLGKMLQAIPIILFNIMSPFFYRLMGNIAGIIMIYVMYLFGKQIFQKRKWAILTALLMFFDTFHFAQTRMGTVDSFLVLFIMLSLYFMYRHISEKETKYNLVLSGLFFGLSVCVKWTGFLAGLALAIIYFIDFFKKKKNITKTILNGFLFFVLIPLIIYTGIYLIYPNNQVTYTDSIKDIIIQTTEMFKYHSQLEEPHFFSSEWYTWPITYKPVWYYTQQMSSSTHGTITGIGNIVIWWIGILSLPYLIYKTLKYKDKDSLFILVTILSLWLPYIFIGRVMFMYHYFPVLPFIILSVAMLIKNLESKTKVAYITPIYLGLVITFFIIYYPVVSGLPVSNNYIENLKLLPTWYF